jgi:hypothetical protein
MTIMKICVPSLFPALSGSAEFNDLVISVSLNTLLNKKSASMKRFFLWNTI